MPILTSEGIPVKRRSAKRTFIIPAALAADGTLLNPPPIAAHIPAKSSLLRQGKKPFKVRNSKVYKSCLAIIALRAQGHTTDTIAQELGVTRDTVLTYLKRGVANNWLSIGHFDDPEDRTEYILKDKAVRNLNEALDEKTDEGQMSARASDIALEVAKGTGILKNHQVTKGDGHHDLGVALQVNVVMPPDHVDGLTRLRAGSIGGAPSIDADIIGE